MTDLTTSDLMRQALQSRDAWSTSVARGEVTFSTLVELSRHADNRALAKLKLVDILVKRPKWTKESAENALVRVGLTSRDTVQSIRRSDNKIRVFEALLSSQPTNWRSRPEVPKGWPFRGKLDLLIAVTERTPAAEPSEDDDLIGEVMDDHITADRQTGGDATTYDPDVEELLHNLIGDDSGE